MGGIKRILAAALGMSLLWGAGSANAQTNLDGYPERPVTLVIPFGIGSGDAQARAFANAAEPFLGQTLVPVNHPGGNTAIGIQHMLSQPADGYTIIFLSGTFPLLVAQEALPFAITDVKPIIAFNADYLVIAVPADSPFETFDELVAYAEENPGRLNVGGTARRGNHHIFAELVMDGAGIEMNYIPYAGANDTLVAMLGGTIDVMATSPSTVRQYVETGEIRLLGVSTSERVDEYPDIPTFHEMGLDQLSDYINFRGYYAHPDTPTEIVAHLSEVFTQAFESEAWIAYLEAEQQIDFYRDYEGLVEHMQTYYDNIQAILAELEE